LITILNFSQRVDGINDTICEELQAGFAARKVGTRYIKARDLTISLCNNCRNCMKAPGDVLGLCHFNDDMSGLLETILKSRCLIVSSPINCYDLPALVRILLERMSVFCYWPDEQYSPTVRKTPNKIKGVLITTSALPGIMVPILTRARRTFRFFAKPIRATNIDYYHLGFKGRTADMFFTEKDSQVVHKIVDNIARLMTAQYQRRAAPL
jgi:multimeric flavodoxin WrbA